jgi:ribose transport system substrate-binding protein
MSKNKLIVFSLLLLVLSGYYLYVNNKNTKPRKEPYAISVICSGESAEEFSVLKSGIDKAADEFNADVSFFTLTKANDAGQQISLLEREVENGANAVLILPVQSNEIVEPIIQADKEVPVIVMQSTLPGLSGVDTVSCDDVQLGRSLAEKIVHTEKQMQDVIILNKDGHMGICNGLETVLKEAGSQISYLDFFHSAPDADAFNDAKKFLVSCQNQILIALDRDTLEILGKAKKNLADSHESVECHLYGVGRSNAIMSMLEEGVINSVAAENEYGIGYLSMKTAVDRLQKKQPQTFNVNFVIADSSNMHNTENESLLFPFIS